MPSQQDYSDAFWLAYMNALKDDWKESDTTAIFVGQQGQLGPPAGSGLDKRFTDAGIYQLFNISSRTAAYPMLHPLPILT